ncbi:hypothetical protein SOVF_057470 [Spinacia oleracea]|nr:hypothetical protein SOVF_057470 [Spinacia oleracea]
MMPENIKRVDIPPSHPSCAVAHAKERTPEPMIAVIMCALADNNYTIKFLIFYRDCMDNKCTYYTAIIGSGVLSLAWATAQLGWLGGISTLLIFSGIMLYTSNLLADCYRAPDPVTEKRNYTYMDEVQANLGRFSCIACGILQYANQVFKLG